MIERAVDRYAPRLPVTLSLQSPGGLSSFGLIGDISTRGACVLTFDDLAIGSTVECTLNFPKQRGALSVTGRVLWNRKESNIPSRYGMQFEDDSIPFSRLEQFIEGIRSRPEANQSG